MATSRLKDQRAYIEAACKALNTDYTGLARKAKISSSTLTRPMNQKDWAFTLSERTLRKVSEASGLPPYDIWRHGSAGGRMAVSLTVEMDKAGRQVITLPEDSPIADEVPALIRLYAAMPADRRKLFMMAMKHPSLTPAGIAVEPAEPSEDLLFDLASSAVQQLEQSRGVTLSKLERSRLIQQTVEAVAPRRQAAGKPGSGSKRAVQSGKTRKAAAS